MTVRMYGHVSHEKDGQLTVDLTDETPEEVGSRLKTHPNGVACTVTLGTSPRYVWVVTDHIAGYSDLLGVFASEAGAMVQVKSRTTHGDWAPMGGNGGPLEWHEQTTVDGRKTWTGRAISLTQSTLEFDTSDQGAAEGEE